MTSTTMAAAAAVPSSSMTSSSSLLSAAPPAMSPSPSSSSTLQEGDGIRKSGAIQLQLGYHKKCKPQPAYAVLSERALELHESEKAHRKKKGTRSIVDLSKCFNVSQQNCPKSKMLCVCLLMPDECFLLRAENPNETTEWYCTLLSAVISARALHLGRPVFANEFFESVWDVTVCPQQPKLKRTMAPPANSEFANSPNICAKIKELSGRKRLCFYPHTIIICKAGIEPAHSGLPKSGIPPFRSVDFVEFSRHFIAQFGPVDKYFLMRIGRSSPMGSCEVWVQCESEEISAEISRKLQEIIQRETEKKQQALMAIRGQQQQHTPSSSSSASSSSACASYGGGGGSNYSPAPSCHPSGGISSAHSCPLATGGSPFDEENGGAPFADQLEPISEDEAMTTAAATATGRKKHSSLSQSAKEKRLELRECKARVDSLEEEEQRFQQRQQQLMAQEASASSGWSAIGRRYIPMVRSSDHQPPVNSRPICLQPSYQFRRRGSSGGTIPAEIGARSKSLSLEEQQAQNFRPIAGRLWTMDKADSLLLLGYGPPETEETEDSGGTLRMIPLDGGSGSQVPSRSSSSLNLAAASGLPGGGGCSSLSSSAGQLIETYVECHAAADDGKEGEEEDNEDDGDEQCNSSTSGSSTEEEEQQTKKKAAAKHHRRNRRKNMANPGAHQQQMDMAMAASQGRRQQRHIGTKSNGCTQSGTGSLDAGAEADQSCSCSSSVASSSGVHDDHNTQATSQTDLNRIKNNNGNGKHVLVDHHHHHHTSGNNNNSEYTLMDKVSCSSDSFSHLAVPQHGGNAITSSTDRTGGNGQFCCPEEICSYTSDSGDSCYSSMINGQLNPRAFSFSSTSERATATNLHFGTGKLGGASAGNPLQQQHPAAAKWITAAMGGAHRGHHFHQPPAHFSPPKSNEQHGQHGGGQPQQESSSSSRFSMETSLITPLEEDERQVTFADNEEQRDRLGEVVAKGRDRGDMADGGADDLLRKRAFSLGSKSWITKPFRKLSSAHGTPSSSGRHQRSSCGGASTRSGSSSLIGSMHADLCSVQEQQFSQPHLSFSSSHHRLGSSSSFASSSMTGAAGCGGAVGHTRSDSIGSSHSAALSLPGFSHKHKKQPMGDELKNEDLVELEFMPGLSSPFSNRSAHCVATISTPIDSSIKRSPLRGRTNSCDDHGGQQQQQQMHYGAGAMTTTTSKGAHPHGRGSAGALNQQQQARIVGGGGSSNGMQQQGWSSKQQQQQHPRLRPSESFIRSIQQQQRELQRTRQQQQRQRIKTEFPLQEVQCFIAPDERQKIDAMTARDSLSLRSQRSGSGSCSQHQFETIDELQQQNPDESRPQSRRSLPSKPPMLPPSPIQQQPVSEEEQQAMAVPGSDEGDYVLSEVKSSLKAKA